MSREPTSEELDRAHAKLQELAESLQRMSDSARSETVDLDLEIGRLSRIDAIQQQRMAEAERRRAGLRLKQVRAALARLNNDEFGECAACGEWIAPGRLHARPEVPFCVACQAKRGG